MTEAEFKNSEFYTECLAEYKALSKEELIDKLIKESWYVCELEDDADALCCANILIDRLEERIEFLEHVLDHCFLELTEEGIRLACETGLPTMCCNEITREDKEN